MKSDKNLIFIFLIIILFIIFKLLWMNDITFFWDSISCLSKPANFFYVNNLNSIYYNEITDNGDPHIVTFLLAFCW